MGDLVTITGNVTVGGSPMKSGTIHFKATAAGGRDELAVVTDGKYTLTAFNYNHSISSTYPYRAILICDNSIDYITL